MTTALSPEESRLRVQLAAAYRICHHEGWDELIYNHLTARVPGPEAHFLINPFGLSFDEVSASSLVKVDLNGKVVAPSEYPINPAGFVIHSAIHAAREDVHCVAHLHTPYGIAMSSLDQDLPMTTQTSMPFYGKIAYHDYEGIALNPEEKTRLIKDLGNKNVLILRNHGLLTAGSSIAEAISMMYFLERACHVELLALSAGRPAKLPTSQLLELVSHQEKAFNLGGKRAEIEFAAMQRRIDRIDPSYRN